MSLGHNNNGILIAFEGVTQSGKSTVIHKLGNWLSGRGLATVISNWNSTEEINPIIQRRKRSDCFTPLIWSALHFADFVIRYEEIIMPALENRKIVIADRYIYTAFTRDTANGLALDQIKDCYGFAIKPDLVFCFTLPGAECIKRRIRPQNTKGALLPNKMHSRLHSDLHHAYIQYQDLILEKYHEMGKTERFVYIDGRHDSEDNLEMVIQHVSGLLKAKNYIE